jgi:glycerate 2-kinase
MVLFAVTALVIIMSCLSSLRVTAWTMQSSMYRLGYQYRMFPDRRIARNRQPFRQPNDSTTGTLVVSMSMTSTAITCADSVSKITSPQRTQQEIYMSDDIKVIIQEAIHAVDPVVAMKRCLQVEVTNSKQPRIRVVDNQINAIHDSNKERTEMPPSEYNFDEYDNIIVVGIGKAASAMVSAVVETFVPVIDALQNHSNEISEEYQRRIPKLKGFVMTKHGHITQSQCDILQQHNITIREASHPIPCEAGVSASYELLDFVSSHTNPKSNETDTNHNTLFIACISGGGSALFCTPIPPLTLQDLKATNTALLQTGWPISSMNIIRTALEQGKGGGLALAALNQQHHQQQHQQPTVDVVDSSRNVVLSFILSDVIGDPLDIIASGPTILRSEQSRKKALQKAYELVHCRTPPHIQFPKAVVDYLQEEYERLSDETYDGMGSVSSSSSIANTQHCFNYLVGNNAVALDAAASKAMALGYYPIILSTQLQGEATTVAQILVGLAKSIQQPTTLYTMNHENKFPVALIAGGETTVTLPNDDNIGRLGGRNQELALAAAVALQDYQLRQIVLASVGTDGNDGPTDAAGAIVDGGTVQRMDTSTDSPLSAKDALQFHNSYPYLNQTDRDGHSPLFKVGTT